MNNTKPYVIAELSANHNNNFELAQKTIEAIAKTGADAVKFQTYTADSLSLDIDNQYFPPIKDGLWKGYRPYDLYQEASTPYEWQPKLAKLASSLGLDWLSSPFDFEAVDFLESFHCPMYKIASFEINDIPLIEYTASTGKPIIISTGIAELDDIELAVKACRKASNNQITLLKCTSQYPSTIEQANLKTMVDLKDRFGLKVGISDHTLGFIVPMVATALGAEVIEKHFILDRALGGPDSGFSMEPNEFQEMIENIQLATLSYGNVIYDVTQEKKMQRRSLFTVADIKPGEKLTSENIRSIRPGNGLSPKYYKEVLGKRAKAFIPKGTPLSLELLSMG